MQKYLQIPQQGEEECPELAEVMLQPVCASVGDRIHPLSSKSSPAETFL